MELINSLLFLVQIIVFTLFGHSYSVKYFKADTDHLGSGKLVEIPGPPSGVQLVISGDKPQTFVLPGTNPARDYIVAIPEKGDANRPAAKLTFTNIQPDNSIFSKFGGILASNLNSGGGLLSIIGFPGRNVEKTAENNAQKKDDQKN